MPPHPASPPAPLPPFVPPHLPPRSLISPRLTSRPSPSPQSHTVGPCSLSQVITAEMLRSWGEDGLDAHLRTIQREYAQRAACIIAAAERVRASRAGCGFGWLAARIADQLSEGTVIGRHPTWDSACHMRLSRSHPPSRPSPHHSPCCSTCRAWPSGLCPPPACSSGCAC